MNLDFICVNQMVIYKLGYKLFFNSNCLRVFRFATSKCSGSKSLQMQVKPTFYGIPSISILSNLINLRCNHSSGNNTSSLHSCPELNEFNRIKEYLQKCLDDAMIDEHIHQGSLVSNSVIQQFCNAYSTLSSEMREKVLVYICCQYGVEHNKVLGSCEALLKNNKFDVSKCV